MKGGARPGAGRPKDSGQTHTPFVGFAGSTYWGILYFLENDALPKNHEFFESFRTLNISYKLKIPSY